MLSVVGDGGFGIGSKADFEDFEDSGPVVNAVDGSVFELELTVG